MRVLIACEESQEVCKAFRNRGHDAWSCDIQDCSGGHPEWHLKCDVTEILDLNWDMIIAFPPCTHLAASGARWFDQKRKDGRQQNAVDFFMMFANYNCCEKIAIENPVGIMSTLYKKPTQIIHPYMFGDPVRKATCLWLKNLPKMTPTNIVEPHIIKSGNTSFSGPLYYVKDEKGKILSWNDPRTAKVRSKTYPGIAKAMAEQWG